MVVEPRATHTKKIMRKDNLANYHKWNGSVFTLENQTSEEIEINKAPTTRHYRGKVLTSLPAGAVVVGYERVTINGDVRFIEVLGVPE